MTLDSLILHPRTRTAISRLIDAPPHAILLSAPAGSGKETVAETLGAAILGLDSSEALQDYPYVSIIRPEDGKTITIEQVREAQTLLKLKTPGERRIRRMIIILEAGTMRHEAQNAFLKTLEEPPDDTCIIFTSLADTGLLPTIRSRMRSLELLPLSENQVREFYGQSGKSDAVISRAYALSKGQAGILHALMTDEDHPLRAWVDTAKQIISATQGDRLLRVDELSKDKQDTEQLLGAISRIAEAGLLLSSRQDKPAAIKRWHDALAATQDSIMKFKRNANTKLLLSDLFLSL